MKCPYCGYENKEGSRFCSGCGRGLMAAPPEEQSGRGREEKKIILIGVILAAVIVAGGIGAYFGFRHFWEEDPGDQEAQRPIAQSSSSDSVSGGEPEATDTPVPTVSVTPAPQTAAPTPTASPTPTSTPAPTPEQTLVSLTEVRSANLDAYAKAEVTGGAASSTVVQEGYDNSVNMVFDEDVVTSWQEGAEGNGEGEFFSLQLDREYQVKYITLNLGNWRDQQRYDENGVPKTLTIWLDEQSFQMEFPHERRQFCLEFSKECSAREIYVRIDEVYEGNLWDDTCISEIGIYGV